MSAVSFSEIERRQREAKNKQKKINSSSDRTYNTGLVLNSNSPPTTVNTSTTEKPVKVPFDKYDTSNIRDVNASTKTTSKREVKPAGTEDKTKVDTAAKQNNTAITPSTGPIIEDKKANLNAPDKYAKSKEVITKGIADYKKQAAEQDKPIPPKPLSREEAVKNINNTRDNLNRELAYKLDGSEANAGEIAQRMHQNTKNAQKEISDFDAKQNLEKQLKKVKAEESYAKTNASAQGKVDDKTRPGLTEAQQATAKPIDPSKSMTREDIKAAYNTDEAKERRKNALEKAKIEGPNADIIKRNATLKRQQEFLKKWKAMPLDKQMAAKIPKDMEKYIDADTRSISTEGLKRISQRPDSLSARSKRKIYLNPKGSQYSDIQANKDFQLIEKGNTIADIYAKYDAENPLEAYFSGRYRPREQMMETSRDVTPSGRVTARYGVPVTVGTTEVDETGKRYNGKPLPWEMDTPQAKAAREELRNAGLLDAHRDYSSWKSLYDSSSPAERAEMDKRNAEMSARMDKEAQQRLFNHEAREVARWNDGIVEGKPYDFPMLVPENTAARNFTTSAYNGVGFGAQGGYADTSVYRDKRTGVPLTSDKMINDPNFDWEHYTENDHVTTDPRFLNTAEQSYGAENNRRIAAVNAARKKAGMPPLTYQDYLDSDQQTGNQSYDNWMSGRVKMGLDGGLTEQDLANSYTPELDRRNRYDGGANVPFGSGGSYGENMYKRNTYDGGGFFNQDSVPVGVNPGITPKPEPDVGFNPPAATNEGFLNAVEAQAQQDARDREAAYAKQFPSRKGLGQRQMDGDIGNFVSYVDPLTHEVRGAMDYTLPNDVLKYWTRPEGAQGRQVYAGGNPDYNYNQLDDFNKYTEYLETPNTVAPSKIITKDGRVIDGSELPREVQQGIYYNNNWDAYDNVNKPKAPVYTYRKPTREMQAAQNLASQIRLQEYRKEQAKQEMAEKAARAKREAEWQAESNAFWGRR